MRPPRRRYSPDEEIRLPSFYRGGGFMQGMKLAVFVGLSLPFLVFLIPVWFIHILVERLSGRPFPEPPWKETMDILLRSRPGGASPFRLERIGKGGGEAEADPPVSADTPQKAEKIPPPGPRPQARPLNGAVEGYGRVVLVTGGARRLGALLCRDLARQGFRVAIAYHHSATEARTLAEEIRAEGGEAEAFAVDLSNPAHIENLLGEVTRRLGPLRVLVNNAAQFLPTPPGHATWEGMEHLFRVNLHGPLWLSLKAADRMGDGGVILNIGDIWGERPLSGHAAYGASKAGLLMATQVLARDLAPRIRVNAILPGAILEPEAPEGQDLYGRLLQRTPLAEAASPDGVLQAVRYLLAAEFVTGELLHVDGGRRLG